MQKSASSKWFIVPQHRPDARARLFCIPYAGAGASVFSPWAARLPAGIELCCVQLPGRERRFTEPPIRRLAPLVEAITEAMLPRIDLPFAIFGHSLGGYVAFELVRKFRSIGATLPALLVPSGTGAPDLPQPYPPAYDLPRSELIEFLARCTNTPEHVLGDEELLDVALPVIRADFEVTDTYIYEPQEPLGCAITALAGSDDAVVGADDLAGWERHTSGRFRSHRLAGNHMYLASPDEQFFHILNDELRTHLVNPGVSDPHRGETSVNP